MKKTFEDFCNENVKEEVKELRERRQKEEEKCETIKNYLIENTREQILEKIKKSLKEYEVAPCTRSITVYIDLEQNEENFIISIYTNGTPRAKRHKMFFPKKGDIRMYSSYDENVFISKDGYAVDFWKDVLDEESYPWSWSKKIEIYLD